MWIPVLSGVPQEPQVRAGCVHGVGMKIETPISRDIRTALKQIGVPCYRIQSGRVKVRGGWMHLNDAGTPDLLATPLIRVMSDEMEIALWIEVKVPGKWLRPEQVEFGTRTRNRGGFWCLAE